MRRRCVLEQCQGAMGRSKQVSIAAAATEVAMLH